MTLVESVIAILIVSVVVVMALGSFGSIARGRRTASDNDIATALVQELVSQIAHMAYAEPTEPERFGPEASEQGGTRENFDDVDDYHQWSASPPQDNSGAALGHLEGWRREVTVTRVRPSDLSPAGGESGLKKFTVTVTSPKGAKTSFSAIRSSSGICDRGDSEDLYIGWIGVDVQIGPDSSARICTGTNILNFISAEGQSDE